MKIGKFISTEAVVVIIYGIQWKYMSIRKGSDSSIQSDIVLENHTVKD